MPSKAVIAGAGAFAWLLFMFIASAPYNWNPMFMLLPACLQPLPSLFCSRIGSDPFGSGEVSLWAAFGSWLNGVVLTFFIGLPAVMLHVSAINGAQFAFIMLANIAALVTYCVLAWKKSKE
eukprot:PLAT6036.2.p1 GENE.PLAT6036.2~~PLAT6036.2.p1  ORF type:complete len:121 (-),score=36.09 PLAT6036.2:82-444(-)